MRWLALSFVCLSSFANAGELRLGIDGRYGLIWQQEPENTPRTNTTASFAVPVTDLLGTLHTSQTTANWRINLVNPDEFLTSATIGWGPKRFRFGMGKMAMPLGGFAAQRLGGRDWWRPRYLDLAPYSYFEAGAYAEVDLGVVVKLTAFRDVIQSDTSQQRWNQNEHPTLGGEAQLERAGLALLLQGAAYDNNKSHWIDASSRWLTSRGMIELSYRYQNDSYRVESADVIRDLGKVLSALTLRTQAHFGSHSVFWEWSEFEVTQANEPGLSRDRKENAYSRDQNGELGDRLWDDHGVTSLLGYEYGAGSMVSWFAWIGAEQGRWLRRNSDHVELFRSLRAEAGLRLATIQP